MSKNKQPVGQGLNFGSLITEQISQALNICSFSKLGPSPFGKPTLQSTPVIRSRGCHRHDSIFDQNIVGCLWQPLDLALGMLIFSLSGNSSLIGMMVTAHKKSYPMSVLQFWWRHVTYPSHCLKWRLVEEWRFSINHLNHHYTK